MRKILQPWYFLVNKWHTILYGPSLLHNRIDLDDTIWFNKLPLFRSNMEDMGFVFHPIHSRYFAELDLGDNTKYEMEITCSSYNEEGNQTHSLKFRRIEKGVVTNTLHLSDSHSFVHKISLHENDASFGDFEMVDKTSVMKTFRKVLKKVDWVQKDMRNYKLKQLGL